MQIRLLWLRILLCFLILRNSFQKEPSQRYTFLKLISRKSLLNQQKYSKLQLWQLFLFYEFSADSFYSLLCRLQTNCCLCSRRNRWSISNCNWVFSSLTNLQSLFLPSFLLTVLSCLQSSLCLGWSMDRLSKSNTLSWHVWRYPLHGYSLISWISSISRSYRLCRYMHRNQPLFAECVFSIYRNS